jgi:hypothetical protein
MDLHEVRGVGVDCIAVAQDSSKWAGACKSVLTFEFHKLEKFLDYPRAVYCLRRTLLRVVS